MYVTEQFVQIVHMPAQDRRITKTRKAIYQAFLQLLNQKDYEAITVQEIIDLADVGRSTLFQEKSRPCKQPLALQKRLFYPATAKRTGT